MWLCSCNKKGKNETDNHTIMRPTTVNEENICTKCGFYAFWSNDHQKHGDTLQKLCTVVKLNSYEFEVMTIQEMSKKLSANSSNFCKRAKLKKPFKPKSGTHVVFFEVLDKIPTEYKKYIFDDVFFVYDLEGNQVLKSSSLKQISEYTKDSIPSINVNLRGETFHSKNNFIYRKNAPDFNVKEYIDTTKLNSDVDYCFIYDSIDIDDIKVSYQIDHYGTWKEKLYS